VIAASLVTAAKASLPLMGVNLAGAEFGTSGTDSNGLPIPVLPGVYNTDYTYPTQSEVDYYLSKGMNTFRLPFLWERLEPDLGTGAFDSAQLGYIENFVSQTTAKGGYVILDPQDFGQYVIGDTGYGIGTPQVTVEEYASFWSQLATQFGGNDHVLFGLMNEPAGSPVITTEQWFDAAQSAINAIRNPLGANAHNTILVPGNYYTGAWSWLTSGNGIDTPNAAVFGSLTDPDNNFLFEVHQYLDENYSGTSPDIAHDPVAALSGFTEWLKLTGNKGFLGEFAVAEGPVQQAAVTQMLNYINDPANSSVWEGWTWWAGGPWWDTDGTNYMFNLDPVNGTDAPQMTYLAPFLAVPEPGTWALLLLSAGAWLLIARSTRKSRQAVAVPPAAFSPRPTTARTS
ncbi:MAG TPA: cellulase family glycosylhydrolase, partial [Chthoniobacterales bacterium]|nr:cellulase family glycosylhydrolase [Chthoniobacterales bacterium]